MLSVTQQEIRRSGIGSSEIAAICGLSFWGDGPHGVYLRKRGLVDSKEQTRAARLGDVMERLIGSEYEYETSVALAPLLDVNDEPSTLRHPEHSWVLASVDRLRVTDLIPVEIKLITGERAHYFRGDGACDYCGRAEHLHWGHEPESVPDDVRCQVLWQLFATGAPWAHVCRFWAARGGPEFRIHTVTRNEKAIAFLLREGHRFWHEYVLAGVPPDPDSSDDSEVCERLHARDVLSEIVAAPLGTEQHVRDYLDGARMIRDGEEKKKTAGNWLRRIVGANQGVDGPGYRVTNKANKNGVRALRVVER